MELKGVFFPLIIVIHALKYNCDVLYTYRILIVIALIGAAWFIYCLDFKDMFFKFLFLLIQLRAQRRAAHYTPDVIKKLSSKEVRRIAVSAIELHVLSALQKIQFATFRKTDFFYSDSLVSGLHELEISWLDLQQAGHSAVSLMELGFSQEELMLIPKQLDDMGDRSDIVALYERVLEERRKSCGDIAEETLRFDSFCCCYCCYCCYCCCSNWPLTLCPVL